jgi:hypothetical protein
MATPPKNPEDYLPLGRPSEYKPEYCEQLIEHMKDGFSFESFGGIIGVSKKTLYNWADNFPEFLHAKERGTSFSLFWWEKEGKTGLWNENHSESEGRSKTTYTKTFNTGVWAINMRNRFKWKNRDDDKDDDQKESKDNGSPKVVVYIPNNRRDEEKK